MKRSELQERISKLCELVQRETERIPLLGYIRELAALVSVLRMGTPEQRKSNYYDDAAEYMPTEEDIQWARSLTNHIYNGGLAVFPDADLMYFVDHQQRTLTLQNPERLEYKNSLTTHIRTVATFERIGYTVNEVVR